jgi:hypothetical protein
MKTETDYYYCSFGYPKLAREQKFKCYDKLQNYSAAIQQLEKRNVQHNVIQCENVDGSKIKIIIIHKNELSKLPEDSKYNRRYHWNSVDSWKRLGTDYYLPFDKKGKNGCALTHLTKGLIPKLVWDNSLESIWKNEGRDSSICW